ncbi:hypothetical protein [Streptomyces viridosporus]|nr:hypothetical protein [Streptomyces viridosporus]
MTRTVVTTENAPVLPTPLSQGIRKGPVLQVSGRRCHVVGCLGL